MSKPARVLQIVSGFGMGGAETWLMEVLRLWAKTGAGNMDFLLTGGKPEIFDEEAVQLGANLHYVPFRRGGLNRFTRDFRRILYDGHYDAIHDHADYVSGWHFLLGAGCLPPIRVTHIHNPTYQIRNNYGLTRSRRVTAAVGKHLVAAFATHITGTSRQVLQEYGFNAPRFGAQKRFALHCGFEPARFLQDAPTARVKIRSEFEWPANTKIALFAGRIDESPDPAHPRTHKNAGFAVDVAIAACHREPAMRFLFAGAKSAAIPILERRLAEAGFTDRVAFAGVRRDIEILMAASDVLLFPSRGEALGMVVVEAQAAGLPVLASTAVPKECVVVPELVRFKELATGAGSWAADLVALSHLPQNALGANERVCASAFSIQNSARALHSLYSGLELC